MELCGPIAVMGGTVFAVGVGVYTAGNWANNASKLNINPFDGWNLTDAYTAGLGTWIMGSAKVAIGTAMVLGAVVGTASDAASQQSSSGHVNWNHAFCMGFTSGYSAGVSKPLEKFGFNEPSRKGVVWDTLNTFLGGKLCEGQ